MKLSLLATYRLHLVANMCAFFFFVCLNSLFYRNRSRLTTHFLIASHSQYVLTPSHTQFYVTYNPVKYLCRNYESEKWGCRILCLYQGNSYFIRQCFQNMYFSHLFNFVAAFLSDNEMLQFSHNEPLKWKPSVIGMSTMNRWGYRNKKELITYPNQICIGNRVSFH